MKQFYFKSLFLSLLMMVIGMNVASAQTEVTLWQEDFSSYSKDAVPSGGTYSYECTGANTKIYEEALAGGTSPELLLQKSSNGSLTATIPLSNIEGDLTLTFKTNNQKIKVSSSTEGITGGLEEKSAGTHTATFSGVTTSMTSITIEFLCSGSSNVRLDDIVLKGTKSASAPTRIAINETNFPDDVFRAWVAENCDKADDNGDKDGYLDDAEIAAQNAWIILSNKNIEDLKGIEYFTAVKSLMCDNNKLTSLDVSKNTALGLLHCTDNQLTSLNVSKNTELTMLLCQNNQLTSLDVSNNQKLTTLDCSNNLINEAEMGKLVASMPTLSGDGVFYPFNLTVEDANVITTTQVDEAKSKNWKVQAYNGEGIGYVDYDGVEPTPETNDYYKKVTSAPEDWSGEYLIVYEEGSVAFNGGLSTLDAVGNTIEVEIDENKIKATDAVDAATFTIAKMEAANTYSIKSASGNFIGVTGNSNGLKQSDTSAYAHNLSVSEGDAVIAAAFDGSSMTLRYNSASNQARFRYYKDYGQKAIQLYKKTVALDNQYTLVTVEDEGETETAFDGNSLTKELPAQTKFYIKDNNGNKYYGTADDYGVATILAENHENMSTSATGANFYLRKANTWVFTVAEQETAEGITLTVNPETAGETKYMITPSNIAESEDVFDKDLQLTKVMTTEGFYLMRSDDYGLFELTAAESNVENYYVWEFSEDNSTVGFLVNKRINTYRVDEAGTYTFTLDTENNTLTAEFISGKQYTLVADDGTEYPFEGLTLTQEITGRTEFYIKDNTGKMYYASENTEDAIISAENHENLPTYESGNNFVLKKANTWVFTLTELETTEGITLSVNPEEAGETKYMISQSLTEETEDVFDENLQLTKEMDTTPFYIIRSDDYGIFELTATDRTNPEGFARFTFTEDHNTAEFEAGKRKNMYEMSEEGTYTFTINLTNNTVTAEKTAFDLYALVTNAENLAEGDKVIIVNTDNTKAMSTTQNTNNRGAADVTFEDGKAKVPAATDIQVFTLEADTEGEGWYFKTDEGYIYASSKSSNQLKTEEEKDDNAKAVITIEDEVTSVVFQGANTRNTLQYNPNNNNPIFNCYASASQKPVQIYRLVNEKDVTVNISSVGYATLYYGDRALRVPAGVTAKTYKVTNGKLEESKVYETGSVIPAGQAVVLKGAKGDYPFYYTEVTGESDSESMLKGSDDDKDTEGGTYYYALQAKKSDGTGGPGFYWMKEDGAVFKNGAHKAYLALENKFGSQEVGGAKSFYLFEEATGIRNVQTDNEAAKEQRFNLSGQRVGSGYKGIVIVNGKKFMKK